MNFIKSTSALVLSIALASTSAIASEEPPTPTKIGCSKHAIPAEISFNAIAVTSPVDGDGQSTCPLLDDRELRKLVNKFAAGSVFAHPLIPGTCLSGSILDGTLSIDGEDPILINTETSYSESAQRLFPVPEAQGSVNLFAKSYDSTLQAGAAMTAVHLEAGDYTFNLLADDHYLLTDSGEDTEDFVIVGSKGDNRVSGRLTGRGQIYPLSPFTIGFAVFGSICIE